ncbi:MAG: SpoVR family protein [Candidatus Paceibacterota bacterium]|jgi:stage V sporulation protein R
MDRFLSREIARLEKIEVRIREYCLEEGLNIPANVKFLVVSPERIMADVASNGIPNNYSVWVWGKEYERMKMLFRHSGEGIPYEVVWNFSGEPVAYIVESNPFALKVLTMAHVFGHVDFFLSNRFCLANKNSVGDILEAASAARIRFAEYQRKYGVNAVEGLIEAGLVVAKFHDPDPFAGEITDSQIESIRAGRVIAKEKEIAGIQSEVVGRGKTLESDPEAADKVAFINRQIDRIKEADPLIPEYDLIRFLAKRGRFSRLPYAVDVLDTIRQQSRYQMMQVARLAMLNEGWATYWHRKIMRRLFQEKLLTDEEHQTFIKFHSGVVRPNPKSFNHYYFGLSLYDEIEDRWNRGTFGPEYDRASIRKKLVWDSGLSMGRKKIFEVSRSYNDVMAMREFFTDEFIARHKICFWRETEQIDKATGERKRVVSMPPPSEIRQRLVRDASILGCPTIKVVTGNYEHRGELCLLHEYNHFELDPQAENGFLEYVHYLWNGPPVHLVTWVIEYDENTGQEKSAKRILHTCEGKGQHKTRDIAGSKTNLAAGL